MMSIGPQVVVPLGQTLGGIGNLSLFQLPILNIQANLRQYCGVFSYYSYFCYR